MTIPKIDAIKGNGIYIALIVCLIAFAVFGRVLPHPPNFAPMAAVAIFAGALLPRRWAVILPVAAMIASDLVISLYPMFMFTWGSFALIAFLSNILIKNISPFSVIGASLGASFLFYLLSNFGVWLQGKMYAMTLTGLFECYYNAIPFFRNTLLGDILFTSVLFSIYAAFFWAMSLKRTQISKESGLI
jgi:hypothetical protein